MQVCEIFESLQGESTFAGIPCFFVRLAGCNLRCGYCDTAYSLEANAPGVQSMSVDEILKKISVLKARWAKSGMTPIVEVTGGEPLVQKETPELLTRLCNAGFTVLLETNGSLPLDKVDKRVHKIVDMKVPSCGMAERNLVAVLEQMTSQDELKFVVGSREDYQWMRQFMLDNALPRNFPVLVSWYDMTALKTMPEGHHPLTRTELADAITRDCVPTRMQVQLHKILWQGIERGK